MKKQQNFLPQQISQNINKPGTVFNFKLHQNSIPQISSSYISKQSQKQMVRLNTPQIYPNYFDFKAENAHKVQQFKKMTKTNINAHDLIYTKQEMEKIEYEKYVKKNFEVICDELYQNHFQRMKKNQQKQKLYLQEKMKECTFNPQVKLENNTKRSSQQFLNQQNKFNHLKNMKISKLKQQLDKENSKDLTFKPKINKNFTPKSIKTNEQSAYQRLYAFKKKQTNFTNYTFKPQITEKGKNVKRSQKIENHLYKDALQRKEKKAQSILEKQMDQSTIYQSKFVSSNSQKLAAQKFLKEFNHILEQLQVNTQTEIDYLLLNQILYRMGFILYKTQIENKSATIERGLVHVIYKLFTENNALNIQNLCIFLLSIIGLNKLDFIVVEQDQIEKCERQKVQAQFGHFYNGNWIINNKDVVQIQNYFNILYRNRLTAQSLYKSKYKQSYNFVPKINALSETLVHNYRNKILKQASQMIMNNQIIADLPENGMVTHVQLLNLQKKTQDKQLQIKKIQQQNFQMNQCTFKPITSSNKQFKRNKSVLQTNRCQELFELSKARIKRKDKKSQDVQFEKNYHQCTFAPLTKKTVGQISNYKPPDYQSFIARIRNSNQQRKKKKNFNQRGYDKCSSKQKIVKCPVHGQRNTKSFSYKNEDSERIPQLFVEVDMCSGQPEKILVFEGDTAKNLAQQFSNKHNLDIQSRNKLQHLLQIEINRLLHKIDEQAISAHSDDK